MQQRKEIYEKALEKLDEYRFICCSISICLKYDYRPSWQIVLDFPEFMLFQPGNTTAKNAWFSNKLEREICLDLCILFCNDKMFEDA
jgi:hypothetical protein